MFSGLLLLARTLDTLEGSVGFTFLWVLLVWSPCTLRVPTGPSWKAASYRQLTSFLASCFFKSYKSFGSLWMVDVGEIK